jgi:3-oxoacyl-[acyl-carrier-protein] synthase II
MAAGCSLANSGENGMTDVVITGIGLVTPLGQRPAEVLARIAAGEVARGESPLGAESACPSVARVADFDVQRYFPENKSLRLMNRDAELAVVAAGLAIEDARLEVDRTYPADEIGLFGSTGLSGMPAEEIGRLVEHAAAADGSLDLERFGRAALRRIRPVLSFKILANMPICFVSIFHRLCGPNAVYTPWEGQGAQAIAAGIRAVRRGDVPCAVVGGCDVKTHEMALLSLQQLGALRSWNEYGRGTVPGEGAAFLVLEDESQAIRRSARVYARIRQYAFRSVAAESLSRLAISGRPALVAAGDGDVFVSDAECEALRQSGIKPATILRPKEHLGNAFAAAAAIQVALAAELASRSEHESVLANCIGFGAEQGCFVLEAL